MSIQVKPSGGVCGAAILGVDLRRPLAPEDRAAIHAASRAHKVIWFPDQAMSLCDFETAGAQFGPYGEDPFIAPLPGHPHVIEVKRLANESGPIFAEAWHSDWSFLPEPPAATLLYGVTIPPVGGDTLFADLAAAYAALPAPIKAKIADLKGVHSARRGYAKDGAYGTADKGRSMTIVASDAALATHTHPLVRPHPETGAPCLFASMAYTIGIEGMAQEEGFGLLLDLFRHQAQPDFVYRHSWAPGMATLWDNRCLNHMATGGYQGHDRLLWRSTIARWGDT